MPRHYDNGMTTARVWYCRAVAAALIVAYLVYAKRADPPQHWTAPPPHHTEHHR